MAGKTNQHRRSDRSEDSPLSQTSPDAIPKVSTGIAGLDNVVRIEEAAESCSAMQKENIPWIVEQLKKRHNELLTGPEQLRPKEEDSLRKSLDYYRLLFDANPCPMFVFDEKTFAFLKVNDSAIRLYGYSRNEFYRMTIDDIRLPEDIAAVHKAVEAQAGANAAPAGLWRHRTKDGRMRWVELAVSAIVYEGKKARVVLVNDITERKEAEEAVRRGQREIEDIYRNAPVGLCLLDTDLRFIRVNDRLAEINGFCAAEHVGRHFREVVPDLADEVEPAMRCVLQSGRPRYNIEIVGQTPAQPGIRRSWMEHWLPAKDDHGQVTGLNIVVEETTEQRQAQEQIRNLSRFPEENPFPVLRLAADGTILYSNKPGGVLLDQWGREVGQQVPPDWCTLIADVLNASQYKVAEMECGERYFSFALSPNAEGGYVNIYGRDLTLQKTAEINQGLLTEILQILNRDQQTSTLISEALTLIQQVTGFEAVGLRLRRGYDYPYFEYNGFSQDFIEEENRLCAKNASGAPICDERGQAVLECTCGLVLSGKVDSAQPGFTAYGSFWTNVSRDLLDLSAEADPRTNPRNRCIHDGYQSVGLFPVKAGDEIIGLLQLNDRRGGRFTAKKIAFYETLAQNIGMALHRLLAEETLRESNERLQMALDAAYLLSFEWDIQRNEVRRFVSHDPILSQTPNDRPGTFEQVLETVHPEDRDLFTANVQAALKDPKGQYRSEFRIVHADGSVVWLFEQGQVKRDAMGNPLRLIGLSQDITARKEAEQALYELNQTLEKRIEERTSELVDANRTLRAQAELLSLAHDMIIVHDLEGRIIFWNKCAEKTYGFTTEEALGRVTHDILQTKYSEPMLKIISAVSTYGHWQGEMVHTAKDGTAITVESRWTLQRDEEGRPMAILEIDRDISDRKLAQQQTEEARRYAESIIETIEESLLVLDSDFKVLSANRTFYETFSETPETVIGKTFYEVSGGQWRIPEFQTLLEGILPKQEAVTDYELQCRGKKGPLHLVLNAKQMADTRRDTKRILLAFHDVTSLKYQEKMLKDLTEELLLAEEQQRQQVATVLHDSIGQMLAFSRREISSLLKKSEFQEDASLKKVSQELGKCIRQSRELTADLSSPTLHTFGLEAGIEELAEQFSEEHGFKCSFHATPEPKLIEKKVELLLYRSVKELLCNIAKHAKAEHVNISVETGDDHMLVLTISDDGEGFDMQILDNNHKSKKSYGLFSIRQRLTNISGAFNLESEKKKGTKVVLKAPLRAGDSQRGE